MAQAAKLDIQTWRIEMRPSLWMDPNWHAADVITFDAFTSTAYDTAHSVDMLNSAGTGKYEDFKTLADVQAFQPAILIFNSNSRMLYVEPGYFGEPELLLPHGIQCTILKINTFAMRLTLTNPTNHAVVAPADGHVSNKHLVNVKVFSLDCDSNLPALPVADPGDFLANEYVGPVKALVDATAAPAPADQIAAFGKSPVLTAAAAFDMADVVAASPSRVDRRTAYMAALP